MVTARSEGFSPEHSGVKREPVSVPRLVKNHQPLQEMQETQV